MTHTLTLAYSRSGESIAKSVPITSEGAQSLDIPVAGSTTNKEVQLGLVVARLSLVFITSDQTVTLKTNSSSAPPETITITADKPLVWYTGCGWANPFATDVTKVFLTNAGATEATVTLRYGYDATP